MIPSTGGSEVGPWVTNRTLFTKEIMNVLSPSHPAKKVVYLKAAQMCGTEIATNAIMAWAHHAPGPMLYVHSTLDTAEKWSKQRFQPSVDMSPAMAEVFTPKKSKSAGNTIYVKEGKGFVLMIVGSNSASSLRSMPIRYLILDEVSSYEPDVDNQGDVIGLSEIRTNNFALNKKIFMLSTPGVEGVCRITKEYLLSDMRKYFVPCPFCGQLQLLEWDNLKFNKDNLDDPIYYECSGCHEKIHEHHKTFMLEHGQWIAEHPERETVGFFINALYCPLGWVSWKQVVHEFLKTKDNPIELKRWVNNYLAQTFKDKVKKVNELTIYKNREIYPAAVPDGVAFLTQGTDVQKDRLIVSVLGFGLGFEAWVIQHQEIIGSPLYQEVWQAHDRFQQQVYLDREGNMYNVICTCIDSSDGNTVNEVYTYCKPREYQFVYPVKGVGGARQMVDHPKRNNIANVLLFSLGVDSIKDHIFNKLEAGRFHLPESVDLEYCKQLTGEVPQFHTKDGFSYRKFVQVYANHALDTAVYAHAAALIRQPTMTQSDYDLITAQRIKQPPLIEGIPAEQPQATPVVPEYIPEPDEILPVHTTFRMNF
ncbi:MAG: phage terminase large subunit family protein [Legionellales bacterium]